LSDRNLARLANKADEKLTTSQQCTLVLIRHGSCDRAELIVKNTPTGEVAAPDEQHITWATWFHNTVCNGLIGLG